MGKDIKFVYFDIGGVLFNFKDAVKSLAEHVNRSYEEVYAVFKKYDDQVCRGKISPGKLWQFYKKELNLEIEIDDFLDWWTDHFTPIKPTHELVKEVSKHYKVGILTNIYKGAFVKIISKGHVPDLLYDIVIQSCELDLVKPEKEFFIYAQKQTGVSPSEVLFIDDSKANIEAAEEIVGWNTVLYDENNPEQSIQQIKQTLNLD